MYKYATPRLCYNGGMANKPVSTSIRLTAEAEALRIAIAEHMGISLTGAIEVALREYARAQGITPTPAQRKRALQHPTPKVKRKAAPKPTRKP